MSPSRSLSRPVGQPQKLAARGQRLSDFRKVYAYCDSLNDLPLLSQVSNPVAVNADPVLSAHARHMGWPVLQIGQNLP
jgi:phosphoserine phosphatase